MCEVVIGSLYHSDTFGINYRPISTTLTSHRERVSGATCIFMKSSPMEAEIDKMARCFSCSAPLITDLSQKHCLERMRVLWTTLFSWKSPNGRRDTGQMVRCCSCSAPLITDLSQKHRLQRMRMFRTILFSWKPLQWKPRYRPNGTLRFMFSAINYWPITETYIACSACVCSGLLFSWKSLQWKTRYRPKGTLLFVFSAIN